MPIEPEAQTIIGGLGVLGGTILALQALWRKFRRERVEGHKDNAEINILRVLENQIATLLLQNAELTRRADEAFHQRNEAMQDLGRLRGRVEHLERVLINLGHSI